MELPVDAPAASVTGKVMVYDGECPMCCALSAAFVRAGVFPEAERRPYLDFEGELATRLWEGGIRNEILILDPASGELRAGARGILWMLRSTWAGPLARLLSLRPLVDLCSVAYRLLAYNRRFLSVPKPRAMACACDPDERPGYTWLLIALAASLAAGAVTLVGAQAPAELRVVGSRLGLLGPLVKTAGPWGLPALGALFAPAGERLRYAAHLAVTAGAGGLALLPLGLAGLLAPDAVAQAYGTLLQVSCLAAGGWMLALWRRRVAFLALSPTWLWTWAAGAGLGLFALGWLHVVRG
ncbi:MAG: hypothetical protein AAF682_09375 [Planctomycetota bacterium]